MRTVACSALIAIVSSPSLAIDDEHLAQGRGIARAAVDYLRARQDGATGGWNVTPDAPNLPAITALVVQGMVLDDNIDGDDPAVRRAIEYILSFVQDDGGIYDRILPSYNTSLCLSALALSGHVATTEEADVIAEAQTFLRSLQWCEDAPVDLAGEERPLRVDREHPFYGGIGYGSHSRPDNSNLFMALEALRDSGVGGDDPFMQRALVFLQRTQMHDDVNDMDYADGSAQGGFIYATGPEGDKAGEGESKAGQVREITSDGALISRLACYGSMTYGGFKSYAFAGLDRDDPRVVLARTWISGHYTLEENPGVGPQGFYYYLLTFSKALDAWGEPMLDVHTADGSTTTDWANDLIDRLAELQQPDGSFRSLDDRWMEGDPVLITAYALIAVEHAINQ